MFCNCVKHTNINSDDSSSGMAGLQCTQQAPARLVNVSVVVSNPIVVILVVGGRRSAVYVLPSGQERSFTSVARAMHLLGSSLNIDHH